MSAVKAFLVVSTVCFLAVSAVYGDALRFMPEKERRQEDLRFNTKQTWPRRAEALELPLDLEDEGPQQTGPSTSKGQPLSFASYYGNHMVLQQYKNPKVWGFADPQKIGRTVTLNVTTPDGTQVAYATSIVIKGTSKKAIWSVLLNWESGVGPHNISATLDEESIMISDVILGDVWLCSGQSNMQFSMPQLNPEDLERELASAHLYSGVRLFTVKQTQSDVPQIDLMAITQRWSVASAESLNGQPWGYFSAVCWLYGRRLYESLGYPIGLIATDYGGTPVKAWSSPDALKVCAQDEDRDLNLAEGVAGDVGGPSQNSVLWNAMIHPLLNMSIYGAIWYQGEADAGKNNYNCTFPAMIADWRHKFNEGSGGQTDPQFPFGFVQLAPWHNSSTLIGGFPSLRWQQTANYGYVPNPKMPNVFMAVSIDLPDFKSPYTGIHPRYKETIAERLFLAGVAVAYNTQVHFQGPLPNQFYVEIEKPHAYIEMHVDSEETSTAVRVMDHDNAFEVCCKKNNSYFCEDESPFWSPAPIISRSSYSITVSADACGNLWIMGLRYAWRESPCLFKRCAIYSVENDLPTPPFVKNGIFGSTLEGKVSRIILYHDKK